MRDVRARLRDLGAELDGLTDSVHKDEMARAELRLRIEALEARSLEELGLEVEALVAEYGPDQLVPPVLFRSDADPTLLTTDEAERPSRCPTTARSRPSACAPPSGRWRCSAR